MKTLLIETSIHYTGTHTDTDIHTQTHTMTHMLGEEEREPTTTLNNIYGTKYTRDLPQNMMKWFMRKNV